VIFSAFVFFSWDLAYSIVKDFEARSPIQGKIQSESKSSREEFRKLHLSHRKIMGKSFKKIRESEDPHIQWIT